MPAHVEVETQTGTSYRCRGGRNRREDFALFVITLSGEGVFHRDGRDCRLPSGTCFLALPSDPKLGWRYPAAAVAPWTFLWFGFRGEISARLVESMNQTYGWVYDVGLESELVRRLLAFEKESETIRMLTPNDGARLVWDVLAACAAKRERDHLNDPHGLLIRRVRQVVLDGVENGARVDDVARRLEFSREHLSRVFKAGTGSSLESFILRSKMTRGCELLKDSTLSCKEIAVRLGYENPTNFSRAFKRTVGMTPKEFRASGAIPMF